jgi:hypothetical protein
VLAALGIKIAPQLDVAGKIVQAIGSGVSIILREKEMHGRIGVFKIDGIVAVKAEVVALLDQCFAVGPPREVSVHYPI